MSLAIGAAHDLSSLQVLLLIAQQCTAVNSTEHDIACTGVSHAAGPCSYCMFCL